MATYGLFVLVILSVGVAEFAHGTPRSPIAQDVRAVLDQKPSTGPARGHQLSPEERAELRRQIIRLSKQSGKDS